MDWLNRCHFGDVREVLRRMAADGVKVQTIVTSPPYWGLRSYLPAEHPDKAREIGSEPTLREFIDGMVEVFDLAREVLADDGTIWVNMGDSYAGSWGGQSRNGESPQSMSVGQIRAAPKQTGTGSLAKTPGLKPKDLMGQPWRLAFALQDDGWYLRQDIIWHKPNPMPDDPQPGVGRRARKLADEGSGTKNNGSMDEALAEVRNTRNRRTVWTIPSEPYSGSHFATFPRALIEPCILAGAPPGGVVLDIFMGSGTTAQVAEQLGRQWIGIDLDERNAVLQRERLRQPSLTLETA